MEEMNGVRDEILAIIRKFPDFPKQGIVFCDIMPLMKHPQLMTRLCQGIAKHYDGKVDAVAGLEARGFLFGPQVAQLLNVPFTPIRKKGKLPGPVISAGYVKEYGVDIVEIQSDALNPGARVLVIDDLLATGGTLKAALDLIRQARAFPVESFALIELECLNGRGIVGSETNVESLIKIPDVS
ncbi:Adenine phosphoribosyltransferase [Aphelenchoides bicaudatus]|nr:Adenine phosphoribosyltransferase [Aphelenchoides bicaudatus]